MHKRSYCVIFLVFLLTISQSVFADGKEVSFNKSTLLSADDFYRNKVDKQDYEEFIDSQINVRKLIKVKDLPNVFDEKEWGIYPHTWRNHLKKAMIGNTKDLNPEQPVYYFLSVKDKDEKVHISFALYDAHIEKIRSQGGGHWTKKEFKRKFEQDKTSF